MNTAHDITLGAPASSDATVALHDIPRTIEMTDRETLDLHAILMTHLWSAQDVGDLARVARLRSMLNAVAAARRPKPVRP